MSQSNSSTTSSSSGAGSISGGPSPIKRSDELAARGGRMKAHKTSSRLSGGGVGSGVGGAKVADEREDQTRELATTAKAAAASEKQKQQTAASAQTVPIQPTEAAQASKLVFGLNPRAHRPQLSSSFAKKLAPSEQQQNEESDRDRDRATEAPITSRFTNNLAAGAVSGRASQKSSSTSSLGSSASSTPTTGIQSSSSSSQPDKGPTKRSGPTVRASKYGNFYKPQDSAVTTKNQTSTDEQQVGSPTGKPITSMTKTTTTSDQKAAPTNSRQTATTSGPTSSSTNATRGSSKEPPATSGRATVGGTGSGVSSGAAASSNSTGVGRPNSVRSTSKSPDRSKQMARRKSFDEDISTIKIESSPAAAVQQQQCQLQQQQSKQAQQQQQQQQNPILKTRTQFNILPPPQLAIATTGKGSVVGYAKSRIYDRPVKQILANPPESTYSALDDRSGQIPASILSGFKPPKQVNVSKAREKWEGGEPFAKCKSRQRLAAQANKKLFPGTWSITSVVATQQLHLQQALAQSASSANHRSNPLETDPSVKVLTRGSVLERVQQFEKAPVGGPSSSSSGGGTGSVGGLSTDSLIIDNYDDLSLTRSSSVSRSSSSLSSTGSLGSDGSGAVQQQQQQQQAKGLDSSEPSSKQAQYKTLVSTIQQQQLQQASVDVASSTQPLRAAYVSATGAAPAQQRRLSLRRRSSLGGLSRSSTSESLIPKFYHPNGKPNTYEMEIRKRDIVACFDKFPERKAHIAPTSATGRKQFHQIALACGYSEYFKVPLQQFVVHKLETDPKLARMSASHQQQLARQRKTSTVALNTNGTSPPIRPLMKAASVDSTAPSSRPVATDSGAGSGESPPTGSAGKDKRDTAAALSQVTCEQFLACWRDLISHAYDNAAQFIHLLTLGQRNYLTPDDFVPLVQSIIDDHPGLKFLRAAPDFHMRYIQTVIARIYFNINRSWTGKITLQELRKSNLLAVLMVLGQEEDINQITDYFSYEHFYVIYCKFWNLDQDHDLFISKEDLARHNDAAISSRIIERIFSGIVSKQIQQTGRMSYSDFVWFLIAEEDKKHPRSVEYWFRLMDLDGDGYISMYEMEYFYYEQTKRLELMNIEALPFLDSACQILDLVNPREKNKISLADLKRTKMATIFFDTFINLEKYLEHESREFVSTRDIVQGGVVISDWDRYASEEYENLVTEESTV